MHWFERLEQQAKERQQNFLNTTNDFKGWKIRVTLSASEVFSICKALCRSSTLDNVLKKQNYRIFDCEEEKQVINDVLHRLLMTHRRSSCHLARMTHPNYNDPEWHGTINDVMFHRVHGEFMRIDIEHECYEPDKEKMKKIINELKIKRR